MPGVTLSVGSQRNLSNNFVVDGLSANDDAAGLSGITFAVDAIEQFQVVTSGAQAELGRALGSYINVVTKSGNNTTRGTVYGISVTIASTPPMRCRVDVADASIAIRRQPRWADRRQSLSTLAISSTRARSNRVGHDWRRLNHGDQRTCAP